MDIVKFNPSMTPVRSQGSEKACARLKASWGLGWGLSLEPWCSANTYWEISASWNCWAGPRNNDKM